MALYLTEGGGSDRLLSLSCCHVLIGSKDGELNGGIQLRLRLWLQWLWF